MKFLAKPISDLCELSINSEKDPDLCKLVKMTIFYLPNEKNAYLKHPLKHFIQQGNGKQT